MSRIGTLIGHDIRLQYRYGIYAAYAVVVVLYVLALRFGSDALPQWAVAFVIFSDPAALGFFFLGALMLLENAERVRAALAAAPVRAADYYVAKSATLSALALLSCLALMAAMRDVERPMLLLLTVALTSVQYVGIGVLTAYRFRTVNGYLIGSAAYLIPLILPSLLALLDPMPLWLAVIPAVSQLRLMMVAVGAADAAAGAITLMLVACVIFAALASWAAVVRLRREFGK